MASQLERWLETDESKEVGDKSGGSESVGDASGRRVIELRQRHVADVTETHWRYSLMNWGHDPKG